MSFRRTDISLSDLHAICQTIVARWIDHVRRGGSVEFSYMMYRNQLQGFLVLAAGTAESTLSSVPKTTWTRSIAA